MLYVIIKKKTETDTDTNTNKKKLNTACCVELVRKWIDTDGISDNLARKPSKLNQNPTDQPGLLRASGGNRAGQQELFHSAPIFVAYKCIKIETGLNNKNSSLTKQLPPQTTVIITLTMAAPLYSYHYIHNKHIC